jgi:hypothetical protein
VLELSEDVFDDEVFVFDVPVPVEVELDVAFEAALVALVVAVEDVFCVVWVVAVFVEHGLKFDHHTYVSFNQASKVPLVYSAQVKVLTLL